MNIERGLTDAVEVGEVSMLRRSLDEVFLGKD
jgi:hypothetical protein